MFDAKIISSSEDYPHGAFDCHPMTGSTNGYPPKMNPALGEIYTPDDCACTREQCYVEYPALARRLAEAMNSAMPADTLAVLRLDMRTPSNDAASAAYSLSSAAFLLSEYVDAQHPLIKIATLATFDEFKAAVSALP